MKPEPFFAAPSPAAQKLEALRQLFPQAVEVDDKGRIRVNPTAIQLALDPGNPAGLRVEEDGYELRWVGKREAYHQAFVPTDKILSAAHEQSKDWDSTGNLLIKGDNLDALKLLRQSYFGKVKLIYIDPPYNTQSEEFIYRDNFSSNQTDVLSSLGYSADNLDYIKNIYGARTHSGWLSFMYPRLLLARDLLRDDGVIFISIDDNEQAQLKLLCDEVFGQENWIGNLIWKNVTDNNPTNIAIEHENLICYARDKSSVEITWKSKISDLKEKLISIGKSFIGNHAQQEDLQEAYSEWLRINKKFLSPLDRYKYIDKEGIYTGSQSVHNPGREGYRYDILHPETKKACKQPLMGYRFPKETMDKLLAERKILFGDDHSKIIELKIYVHEFEERLSSVFHLDGRVGSYELREHFPEVTKIFDNPKPVTLVSQLFAFSTNSESVVLDFFAGSGTTAEAVMRLNAEDGGNRQFILVQIPQPIDAAKQKEAHDFVTKTLGRPEATIFEISAERIRRAGAKLQVEQAAKRQAQGELLADDTPPLDTGFRVFELVDDPLGLIHRAPLKDATQAQVQQLQQGFINPQTADIERVLSNLLLAESLPLTTRIHTVVPDKLFMAHDVALLLQALPLEELLLHLQSLQATDAGLHYLTVYDRWVQDDNLLLGLDTLMDKLGLGKEKLRLRG